MIPTFIYIFILVELTLVTIADIKYRKILNAWSILNLIVACYLFLMVPNSYPFSIEAFQFPLVFLFVGFGLFVLKIMGGGDSKFLATLFLIIPLEAQDNVFYNLLVITIVTGSFLFIKNLIHNRKNILKFMKLRDIHGIKTCFGTKFAYAPIILISWLWAGWQQFIV